MVNYHGSQKAVVRVSPLVPLQTLVPVICEKCEFDPAHVLLLKDSVSRHELQLDKSLTELDIKELYVHDHSLGRPLPPLLLFSQSISYKQKPKFLWNSNFLLQSFYHILHFLLLLTYENITAKEIDLAYGICECSKKNNKTDRSWYKYYDLYRTKVC